MTQPMSFHNPITDIDEILDIEIPNYDDFQWSIFAGVADTQDNIEKQLLKVLNNLNTTEYKNKLYFTPDSTNYKNNIGTYFRYLYKLNDYIKYNYYLDLVINRHINNLIFVATFIPKEEIKTKIKKQSKRVPNKYFKYETKDLFTGKITYYYENPKTGDHIDSDDGNLLETLNSKKTKKEKKQKVKEPIKFTFNFK